MKLSIIVCTYNRSHAIAPCLDSIAASLKMAMPVAAEIVVVDNASTDDTSATVKNWSLSSSFPVRLVYEPRKGLSCARNCGMNAATGELLIFTDDDCHLDENYIQRALACDSKDVGMVLRGGSVALGNSADLPLTIKTLDTTHQWNKALRSARHENLGNTLLGCNLMMRKTTAQRLGSFDERLGAGSIIPGGEDTDYIYRAYLAGITIEYLPELIVYHHHGRKKLTDGHRLLQNYMLGSGALYAKYLFKDPDLCRQLYWDIKNAIKEIFSGKKGFMQEIAFSNCDKVLFSMKGFFLYLFRA